MNPILSVKDLAFRYPDYPGLPGGRIFSNLSLTLKQGEIALVLARPEQGKTTLCRILAGMVPRFTGGRLQGQVNLANKSLASAEPFQLIEAIGLAFQNPEEQLFTTRCDTEVAFALESLGLPRERMRREVSLALERMGLSAYRQASPDTLSGGEKKKLLLACLLAVNPDIWLLDETLEELDDQTKGMILNLLKEGNTTAIIFSAKWYDRFTDYVSRFFMLSQGAVHPLMELPGSRGFVKRLTAEGFLLSPGARIGAPRLPTGRDRSPRPGKESPSLLLQVQDLRFQYPDRQGFLLQVPRLNIHAGSIVSLIGPNGSGKSTLAKLLCGLLIPQAGQVKIPWKGVLGPVAAETLNASVGYLFQNPDFQIFSSTVKEELAYGLRLRGGSTREIDRRIEEAIRLFGLPGPDTPPALMSYGQRKRLQAAVYFLLDRPLLILDEGDSGLAVEDFVRLVKLLAAADKGLMIITHDLELSRYLADRMIHLESGSIKG